MFLDRHVFDGRRNGRFVDVGAHDGISFSNTNFLEQQRGWSGVCIEANPNVFPSLARNRSSTCFNVAIGVERGTEQLFRVVTGYGEMLSGVESVLSKRHRRRIEHEIAVHGGSSRLKPVKVMSLDSVCDAVGIGDFDLLCVDVEGGEFDVLRSLDLERRSVSVVVVENNSRSSRIYRWLFRRGYVLLIRLGQDDFYVRQPCANWCAPIDPL